MGSAKPLASLSSGLLARKGHAKPAMRPQGFGQGSVGSHLEDLGWNDMGGHAPEPQPYPQPQPQQYFSPQPHFEPQPEPVPVPPVLEQREQLAREVEAIAPEPQPEMQAEPAFEPAAPKPVTPRKAARIARESAEQTAKGKAAFTLRLDAERHLRLRLASAVAHRSAQMLVAQALDEFLDSMPEVEALAAHLPKKKARP